VGVNKGVFSAGLIFTDWLGFGDIWEESIGIGGGFGTVVGLCGISGLIVPANSSSSSFSSLSSPSK